MKEQPNSWLNSVRGERTSSISKIRSGTIRLPNSIDKGAKFFPCQKYCKGKKDTVLQVLSWL